MTNIIATIIITVTTNWVTIGTFTPLNGNGIENVMQGRLSTNTTAIFEWKHSRRELLLETVEGPVVGEKREPRYITNRVMWATNYYIPNWWFTNYTNAL